MDSNFKELPMVVLRGRVFFPGRKVSFELMRKKSVAALEKATEDGNFLFFAAQKDTSLNEVSREDIYNVGVIGKVEQVLKLPGGITKVFAECHGKFKIDRYNDNDKYFSVDVSEVIDIKYEKSESGLEQKDFEYRALLKLLLETFDEYARLGKGNPEFIMDIISSDSVEYISYALGEKVPFNISDKQDVLEETDYSNRAKIMLNLLNREINALSVKKEIYSKVRSKIDKSQRNYFLREEIKIIQEELGEPDGIMAEVEEYTKRMNEAYGMPENVRKRLEKEIERFKRMANSSAEGTVSRDYIELILDMPWGVFDKENDDIKSSYYLPCWASGSWKNLYC